MSIQDSRIIAVRTGKTIYHDGDAIAKVFDSDYVQSGILHEALNMALIQEAGLSVPELLEVCKVEGKWAIRSQYIEGKTLKQLMDEEPERCDAYMDKFIEIQMNIFACKAPLLEPIQAKLHRKIRQSGLDASTRYELHTRLDTMTNSTQICHGDFNPSNIMIRPDGSFSVLDWSHATRGDAPADVAQTYLLFWLDGNIEGAEKYLNRYCEKTDTARQVIQKWMPIVAASRLTCEKMQEREFLLEWTAVADYQ